MLKAGMGEYHLGLLARTEENTKKILNLKSERPDLKQAELAAELGLSINAVGKILRKHK